MRFLQVTYRVRYCSEGNCSQIMAKRVNDYDLYSARYQAIYLNTYTGTLRLLKRQVTLRSVNSEVQVDNYSDYF